ncbi:hypothetical protein NMG60_11016468 [Bertholletia excelsa]
MDGSDMMETDTSTSPSPPPQHPPERVSSSGTTGGDVSRNLLTLARQLIDQGKPSQALQAVVMAMKIKGGDEAVLQVLNRAQELYRNQVQTSSEADELASLFAECAIAEAVPMKSVQPEHDMLCPSIEQDAQGTSILAETGRKQIVLDAFSDGSSFVCLQCGGLVSNHRKDEHLHTGVAKSSHSHELKNRSLPLIWCTSCFPMLAFCLLDCIPSLNSNSSFELA